MTGLVSSAIERELLGELRRHGIVVWLDKDKSYTGFVDGLVTRQATGEFPFPVIGFRGSFLELLFKLEPYGSGLDRQPLLVHMPGFNEESIRQTPVLELYEPGVRFRKSLDTLVREAAHPKPFADARSLEQAAEMYAGGAFEVDRAHRRFEQKRLALLDSSLPHFGPLREVVTSLRRLHRDWADGLARAFAGICTETGFLPPDSLQQRTLFEQV